MGFTLFPLAILAGMQGGKPQNSASAFIFVQKDCPCVKVCSKDINRLAQDLKGILPVSVVLNAPSSSLSWYAKRNGLKLPILSDPSMKLARKCGAQFTLDIVLVDAHGKLVRLWPGCGRDSFESLAETASGLLNKPIHLDLSRYSSASLAGCTLFDH